MVLAAVLLLAGTLETAHAASSHPGTDGWILTYTTGRDENGLLYEGKTITVKNTIRNYSTALSQAYDAGKLLVRFVWQGEMISRPEIQEWLTAGEETLSYTLPTYEEMDFHAIYGSVWIEVSDTLNHKDYFSPEIRIGPQGDYGPITIDLTDSSVVMTDINEAEAVRLTLSKLQEEGTIQGIGEIWFDLDREGSSDVAFIPDNLRKARIEQSEFCSLKGQTVPLKLSQSTINYCKENGLAYVSQLTIKFGGRASLVGSWVKMEDTFVYTGAKQKPDIKVLFGEKPLVQGVDYTVTYGQNTDVGVYEQTITGIGAYTGEMIRKVWINQRDISTSDTILSLNKNSFPYTGKAIRPKATLKAKEGGTLKSSDYTVSFMNNKNVGTATITITAKGENCTGSISRTFKIVKAANPLTVKAKTARVKAVDLAKAKQTLAAGKAMAVSKAQGKVTYKKVSGDKTITVDKKTGKITLAKGLARGKYKVKVKVTAAGNKNYKSGSKTVTVTVQVK